MNLDSDSKTGVMQTLALLSNIKTTVCLLCFALHFGIESGVVELKIRTNEVVELI